MARREQLDPLAGDEVRVQQGRHSTTATFIRHSARGAKAHVFHDGTHKQVPERKITHVKPLPPGERMSKLEEPLRVADTLRRNLGEHRLASEAQETHDAIQHERDHARAMHAIIALAYHGHEAHSRRLVDMLDEHPPGAVADQAERSMADLRGEREISQ